MPHLFQLELPLFRKAPPAEEQRHIQLGARIVDYKLVRSRRRTLGMTIDQRGLRVGAPRATSLREIERFMQQNAEWVAKKLEHWHGHGQARHPVIRDGAVVPVLGEDCVLRVEPGAERSRSGFRWSGHILVLKARPDADLRQLARRALRHRALELFSERTAHYAAKLRIPAPPVALSNAQTRWGSCSVASGIRVSWRLIHSPLWLVDYVVAHELSHLIEMNHSKRFWAVVERLCPDYRTARDELKRLAATCPHI